MKVILIPLKHIEEIKQLTKRAVAIVNRSIAHRERKRYRGGISFEEADCIIYRLVEIPFFYSFLIGGDVACSTSDLVITDDWQSIFKEPWTASKKMEETG